jgi:hypothetical protein
MKTTLLFLAMGLSLMAQPSSQPATTPPAPTAAKAVPIPQSFIPEIQALGSRLNTLAEEQTAEMSALKKKQAAETRIVELERTNLELRIAAETGIKAGKVDWKTGTVLPAQAPPAAHAASGATPAPVPQH